MPTIISEAQARKIASEWHGGQWSGLYAIASCADYSRIMPEQWHDAYWESCRIWDASRPTYQGGKRLAAWIVYKARKYGVIVDGINPASLVER